MQKIFIICLLSLLSNAAQGMQDFKPKEYYESKKTRSEKKKEFNWLVHCTNKECKRTFWAIIDHEYFCACIHCGEIIDLSPIFKDLMQ